MKSIVRFMHQNDGEYDFITIITILLYTDEDKHNFRKNEICEYGKENNIKIIRYFNPETESEDEGEKKEEKIDPNNYAAYGYLVEYGSKLYNEQIIDKIRTNIKNRLLFS